MCVWATGDSFTFYLVAAAHHSRNAFSRQEAGLSWRQEESPPRVWSRATSPPPSPRRVVFCRLLPAHISSAPHPPSSQSADPQLLINESQAGITWRRADSWLSGCLVNNQSAKRLRSGSSSRPEGKHPQSERHRISLKRCIRRQRRVRMRHQVRVSRRSSSANRKTFR